LNLQNAPKLWINAFLTLQILAIALISVAINSSALAQKIPSGLSAEQNADGILVLQGDQPVLQYQLQTRSLNGKHPRSNYIHPLYDLNGNVITEDFPDDHLHHRGIFWAWHQVWVGDRKIGDPWLCKDFAWKTQDSSSTLLPDGSVILGCTVHWTSPQLLDANQKQMPIVAERTEVTISSAAPNYRTIDFRIELLALLPDVKIGGSEDDKGYGGFSPRIKLSPAQHFVSLNMETEPTTEAISAGPWLDISNETSGVTMMTHPTNPGESNLWILRRKRSMQNAVYPGRTPVPVSNTIPTILNYRLVIHQGSATSVPLDELYKDFVSQVTAKH
jgi:hypothetical protein